MVSGRFAPQPTKVLTVEAVLIVESGDSRVELGSRSHVEALASLFPSCGLMSTLRVDGGTFGSSAALEACARLGDLRDLLEESNLNVYLASCGSLMRVLPAEVFTGLSEPADASLHLEVSGTRWLVRPTGALSSPGREIPASVSLPDGVWALARIQASALWGGWVDRACRLFAMLAASGTVWKVEASPQEIRSPAAAVP